MRHNTGASVRPVELQYISRSFPWHKLAEIAVCLGCLRVIRAPYPPTSGSLQYLPSVHDGVVSIVNINTSRDTVESRYLCHYMVDGVVALVGRLRVCYGVVIAGRDRLWKDYPMYPFMFLPLLHPDSWDDGTASDRLYFITLENSPETTFVLFSALAANILIRHVIHKIFIPTRSHSVANTESDYVQIRIVRT